MIVIVLTEMCYQGVLRIVCTTHNHLEFCVCFSIIPRQH